MGITVPIVVYTHTDVSDLWPIFFGELKSHMSDVNVYVAVNKKDDRLSEYNQIQYDDTKPYTERWKEILPQIKEDVILFLHEDMILMQSPMIDNLNKYISYVSDDKVNSIKLISIVGNFQSWEGDVNFINNKGPIFSKHNN